MITTSSHFSVLFFLFVALLFCYLIHTVTLFTLGVDDIKAKLDSIKAEKDTLEGLGTELETKINSVKTKLDDAYNSCTGSADCQQIKDAKNSIDVTIDFSELPDIQSTIDKIKAVQDEDLKSKINEV